MADYPALEQLVIQTGTTLKDALQKIDINAQGVCFVVNAKNKIVGILTDGDIRRALLTEHTLETLVEDAANSDFIRLPITSSNESIRQKLSPDITHIPLVDDEGQVVDYACRSRLRRISVMEPNLKGNELTYLTNCINTNWISSAGKYVTQFGQMVADYCEVPYALPVSNGTVALHLALLALDIGEGDEVIVPDLTFAASINAVLYSGATPVIVDIDLDTWNMSPQAIEQAITPKTKAIMPVHLYGFMCDMDPIMQIAQQHDLLVIEDAAEAIGSEYKGKKAGSFGEAATFSFFGNKTITTGEGGMVLFKNEAHYQKAAVLRDHGMSKTKRYWHEYVGYNYRLTNLQAAIGVAQMEKIDTIVAKKVAIGQQYNALFSELNEIELPPSKAEQTNTYWLYTLLIKHNVAKLNRDEIVQKLLLNGIETRNVFYPLHEMPVYQPYARFDYPNTSFVASQGISLPSSLSLSAEEQNEIFKVLKGLLNTRSLLKKVN